MTDETGNSVQPRALLHGAREVLAGNDTGAFTKPSLGQYPHQWNWDSAFIAIGLRQFDIDRAVREIRALLAGQWGRGLVPHILYPDGSSDYFPSGEFWKTAELSDAPPFATSGLSQPPVLTSAVRMICDRMDNPNVGLEFARETYAPLLSWHRWLHGARDPDSTGLVAIIHPWESGTDNSPRFRAALEALGEVEAPHYHRADLRVVSSAERPRDIDYDRYMYLIDSYRRLAWEDAAIHEQAPFLVEDVLFNAIMHRAERDLLELAGRLGEPTSEIEAWLAARQSAFDERLWNRDAGLYFDFDRRSARQLEANTCATFMPLYGGLAGPEQAARLVREQLLDPERYAAGEGTAFVLPSTSKSSPWFEPRRYWCGPIWLNIDWLVARGLDDYGFHTQAAAVRKSMLELAARSGFVEYYDPRDGSPCGARSFSWSAALTIDLLSDQQRTGRESAG